MEIFLFYAGFRPNNTLLYKCTWTSYRGNLSSLNYTSAISVFNMHDAPKSQPTSKVWEVVYDVKVRGTCLPIFPSWAHLRLCVIENGGKEDYVGGDLKLSQAATNPLCSPLMTNNELLSSGHCYDVHSEPSIGKLAWSLALGRLELLLELPVHAFTVPLLLISFQKLFAVPLLEAEWTFYVTSIFESISWFTMARLWKTLLYGLNIASVYGKHVLELRIDFLFSMVHSKCMKNNNNFFSGINMEHHLREFPVLGI